MQSVVGEFGDVLGHLRRVPIDEAGEFATALWEVCRMTLRTSGRSRTAPDDRFDTDVFVFESRRFRTVFFDGLDDRDWRASGNRGSRYRWR
ncbi:hypothetical protein C493_21291 [Natronolimnohabitans innermongolicus JCM 12255]|uniref:Uncharacterized protein n=1 Tax=Natronolimnohabitans innermongolicus JCM 12255 TaxID=1227499 RepID=L9WHE1_9EURY|nr:hypothetical protein C493_21291 [Natronolimnohabitans innermongolicus JCM 12255]